MLAGARTRVISGGTSCEPDRDYRITDQGCSGNAQWSGRPARASGQRPRRRSPRASDRRRPARLHPELAEYRLAVQVAGDLLGPVPGREMLGAVQRRRPSLPKAQKVRRDQRDRAPRALLPRRVGGGVDDHLAHDAPAGVMGLAARHQEARERLGQRPGVRLGAVSVEMAQRLRRRRPSLDRARELRAPRRGRHRASVRVNRPFMGRAGHGPNSLPRTLRSYGILAARMSTLSPRNGTPSASSSLR